MPIKSHFSNRVGFLVTGYEARIFRGKRTKAGFGFQRCEMIKHTHLCVSAILRGEFFHQIRRVKIMKIKTQRTTTTKQSVYPAVPAATVRQKFTEALSVGNDAKNARTTFETFMRCADEISTTMRSFTWDDFWRVSKRYDSMDVNDAKRLFSAWVETQRKFGRIETIAGCYDSETHVRIGV